MKLLINLSNNLGGGSVQVALSFVRECIKYSENEYVVAANERIAKLIHFDSFPSNFKFLTVYEGKWWKLSSAMKKIEKEEKPDVVFTVFGPSYWRPDAPHVVGYANPYYFNMNGLFKKRMSKVQFIKLKLKRILHFYFMNRDTDVIITETGFTTAAYLNLFHHVKKGFTVSNTCSNYFTDYKQNSAEEESDYFTLLTLSKYYPHKNIEIIKDVCDLMKQKNINGIRFVLTIDEENYKRIFGHDNKFVKTLGPVKPEKCPALYEKCDAMFLPTLAECFSASYPESMIMKKPILTSNLPFATSVCKDAAIYFNPLDVNDILEKILKLKNDKNLYDALVEKGLARFKNFPTAQERAAKYLEICKDAMKLNGGGYNCRVICPLNCKFSEVALCRRVA